MKVGRLVEKKKSKGVVVPSFMVKEEGLRTTYNASMCRFKHQRNRCMCVYTYLFIYFNNSIMVDSQKKKKNQ